MRAKREDIQTPEGRELALTKLANAIFHDKPEMVELLLRRPSRSNGTGNLTTLEFAKRGRSEFREVEGKILFSSGARVPLVAILYDFDRFMPDMDPAYVDFMADQCHSNKYNVILNARKLYTPEDRLETLKALYEAHGATGIDQPSDNFTFDDETLRAEFNARALSPGVNITRPDQAALASYVGLMNAICDLFLDPKKQKAEDMAAWVAYNSPDGHFPIGMAAE